MMIGDQQLSITLIAKINELYSWISKHNEIFHDLEESILKIAQNQKTLMSKNYTANFNNLEGSILKIAQHQKTTINRKKYTMNTNDFEEQIIKLENEINILKKKMKKYDKFEKIIRKKLKLF